MVRKNLKRVLVMAFLAIPMYVVAQTSHVATLNHSGNISSYYGANALIEAYEVCVDGDIITLSGGTFNAVNIEKGITLRGAGMMPGADTGEPTVLIGDFTVTTPESGARLSMEGIYHNFAMKVSGTLNRAKFQRCRFRTVTTVNDDARMKKLSFTQCRVASDFHIVNECNVTFTNCIVWNPNVRDTNVAAQANFEFNNCVVGKDSNSFYEIGLCKAKNTIFFRRDSGNTWKCTFDNGATCTNCLSAGGLNSDNLFENIPYGSNWNERDITKIFNMFTGTYSDTDPFSLTEEGQGYIGTDGTQIGIYGGNTPYAENITAPRIVLFNIPNKTDAQGTLNGINIVLEPAE